MARQALQALHMCVADSAKQQQLQFSAHFPRLIYVGWLLLAGRMVARSPERPFLPRAL